MMLLIGITNTSMQQGDSAWFVEAITVISREPKWSVFLNAVIVRGEVGGAVVYRSGAVT